jgi:hypothetical protein
MSECILCYDAKVILCVELSMPPKISSRDCPLCNYNDNGKEKIEMIVICENIRCEFLGEDNCCILKQMQVNKDGICINKKIKK